MAGYERSIASMESSFAVETECDLQVVNDAVSMDTKNLSDHAVLKLRMQTRKGTPKNERKIPAFIFRSPEYKKILANCLDGCRIEFKPIYEQWQIVKDMMTLAAELARNELQAKVLVTDNDNSRQARLLTLNSVARAVWRQDARLALRLINDTPIGAAELGISDGTVYLKRPSDFRVQVREAQAQLLEREAAAVAAGRSSAPPPGGQRRS